MGAKTYEMQPVDDFGETPLGPGRYTHTLTLRGAADTHSLDGVTTKDD